jgi:site-specific DNA-methyltransferase (adenine-specific)
VSELLLGDCLEVMKTLPDCSVDAVVTDPPYGLSFMGKRWDYDVPSVEIWAECLRVLKPGGHLLAFAGTRTQHRMAVRIEDAGFEIRDMIAWAYGSGFPKSLDVSKAIDKHGGQSVAWFGPWFRNWREAQGINQKQVAALFPSKTGNLTGCVANWELGFNMPTPEQFNLIRDTFGLPFESIQAAEREVVGQHKTDMGGLGGERLGQKGGDITAPATDAARQWQGWGTALKPALEPITMARKPLTGTVAANVLEHGTGALNVDGCRVEGAGAMKWETPRGGIWATDSTATAALVPNELGRWPANLILTYPEDEYKLKDSITPQQLAKLAEWMNENA